MNDIPSTTPSNFIKEAVLEDIRTGRFGGKVHTSFPPEPNGYLHIGHAKAFAIDYGTAQDFGGKYNLRFDDTNPVKEDVEYVESRRRISTGLVLIGKIADFLPRITLNSCMSGQSS